MALARQNWAPLAIVHALSPLAASTSERAV
jgi:hypothetical protein